MVLAQAYMQKESEGKDVRASSDIPLSNRPDSLDTNLIFYDPTHGQEDRLLFARPL